MNAQASVPDGNSGEWCEDVPEGPDQLVPDLLTKALRESLTQPGATVSRVRWERIGYDRGFTGLVARLHLGYNPEGAGPTTMVAKFPLADSGDSGYRQAQQRRPELRRQYRDRVLREAWFYDRIAPRLPVRVPHCWATASDPHQQRLVLLMEDITDAQPGDALRGCSPDEVAAVLSAVAPMHASYWGQIGLLTALPSWSGDNAAHQRRQARYREQWSLLSIRDDLELPPRVRTMATTLCDCLAGVLDELDSAPQTLIHADLHLDNVLFTPADKHRPAVILDWQSVARGPAMLDVAHALVTSLDPHDRRDHEGALLRGYRRKLRECGVVDEQLTRFGPDYQRALIVCFAGVIGWLANTNSSTLKGREAELATAALGDGRLVTALLDHDVDALLRSKS